MKTSFICMFVLVCIFSNHHADAQTTHYYIDGNYIEHFDGSQLVGKNIISYEISNAPRSKTVVHSIYTSDGWKKTTHLDKNNSLYQIRGNISIEQSPYLPQNFKYHQKSEPLILLNGVEFTGDVMNDLKKNIKNIYVYKPDSKLARLYGKKGENGVMEIYTDNMSDSIIYIINGNVVANDSVNRLSPDAINEIKVLKRGSADAIKIRPEGNRNNIIIISTKKDGAYMFYQIYSRQAPCRFYLHQTIDDLT